MDLSAVPGVGEKTATALAELDDPERALREGDVAELARAPGISDGRAANIARAAIRQRHGDPGDFLATDRAREVYREVLGLLQERAVTDYARRRLETFYPSATPSRIREVRVFAREAMERDPDAEVREALAGVEPLSPPTDVRVRDRCVATSDAEAYSKATEALPEVSVEVVDDARDLADLARGYATVYVLDEAFAGVDLEGDVRVVPDLLEDPVEVVPERVLSFFARNRDRLLAAAEVHRIADLDPPLDIDALAAALERIDDEGNVVDDDELDRLTRAVDDLDATVATAESVANDRLREAIEERDVTIEGSDLLSLVERGAGVDAVLSRELADEYDAALAAAREHLVDALDLTDGEASIAERAFGDEPTFPVEHQEQAVARLREELTAARDRRATRQKRELARELADLRDDAEALVDAALELDVELAIARFARDFECTLPTFVDDTLAGVEGDVEGGTDGATEGRTGGTGETVGDRANGPDDTAGFAIEGGRSPLLDVPFEDVEPIDYGVDGVALLSGVNSGGKTSTLDLVATVVVLAQMGLPVPADRVSLRRFDALYYHAKTQGTLDAGAFEATVREFAGIATGQGGPDAPDGEAADALVLVDELESITEPGASATIIAGILEALHERDATAVFVSHLAGEIREEAGFPVTVDGIEAEGLVDGELRVDRTPTKDHLARSTPELIVEKLAGEDGGADADFYDRLLEKFEG